MSGSLFAQEDPTTAAGYSHTTDDGSYGLYFTVAADSSLTAIWFYSPSGASGLPTSIALYSTTAGSPGTGALVEQNSSPSWSGAAGSGWISADIGPVSLDEGTVYVAQYYGASFGQGYIQNTSLPGSWFPATSSDGNITAPEYVGSILYCNGGAIADSNGYPAGLSEININWLLDVEVETSPPPASGSGMLMACFP